MKSSHLIATATALVGFAAGWALKPSGGSAKETADVNSEASLREKRASHATSKVRERSQRPLILKARGSGDTTADPERVNAQIKFERSFGDAANLAENARLSRFTEALGLSPEQRATLSVMLANRRDAFRQLSGDGRAPAEVVQQVSDAERRFEGELEKVLDEEQFDAYLAFKDREKQNDIEARAQRDLADLIGQIDLSEDQREQALVVLRAGSAEALSKRPEGWSILNETAGVIGGPQAAVMDQLGDIMNDPEGMNDPLVVHQRLLESQQRAMEWKIDQLAPILTPGQLAQYRATMSARATLMEQHAPPSMPKR